MTHLQPEEQHHTKGGFVLPPMEKAAVPAALQVGDRGANISLQPDWADLGVNQIIGGGLDWCGQGIGHHRGLSSLDDILKGGLPYRHRDHC